MCNSYRLHVPVNVIGDVFRQADRPLHFPDGQPNLPATDDIRIGDRAPIIMLDDDALQLTMMTWSWKGPGGRPVFNFRSDGRRFDGSKRCLIPADGFYEFTDAPPGQKRKTKWLFTMTGEPWFWIAGVVRDGAFAMLTTEPGVDVAPYHDRQVVVLAPGDGIAWLDMSKPQGEMLTATAAEGLSVLQIWPSPDLMTQ
ncbi:SOS response-associated peptidase [Brevundimonas diminuta]|jgi:putative SOS response-associated peptidase YedK|uniref:Abasic site processing protein n=1 Tax=Brevundimonas diminuta TaxID=293 RepID=A0A381AKH7_BREDI|nr:SOS response-associated peptidase family protein [Brevundimonas diminuta]EGF94515.1 hypothetical protein BDIM_13390 [Brevundimonas diminuta ATCC 11568]MBD3572507.1 SOS response-associated peptidase [Brevundimonas diminuta]OWR20519.1 DUF159 family protein [Brevundimonas diminuta]QAT15021.1 SOS response-associated peptidase [Brevundimonas diminuta]QQB87598.1 SOS response-associated peptidase family protein [Brevundimonas diminuta]